MPNNLNDLLGQYGTTDAWWPEESGVVDRGARDKVAQLAWDIAHGNPNAGYAVRMPQPIAAGRKAVVDAVRPYLTPIANALTKSGADTALNFMGPAAPLAKAAFMVPAQIARLEAAGMLPAGSGTTAGLARAQEAWARRGGMADPALQEAWTKHRWLPAGKINPQHTEPLTWVPETDLRLNPRVASQMDGDLIERRGAMHDLFDPRAADIITTAEPSLRKTPFTVGLDDDSHGVTRLKNGIASEMQAFGPDPGNIRAVANHEITHALDVAGNGLPSMSFEYPAIHGTAAESKLNAYHDRVTKELDRLISSGDPSTFKMDQNARNAILAEDALSKVPYMSGYYAHPSERLARLGTLLSDRPELTSTAPHLIDAYQTGTMPARYGQRSLYERAGLTLGDYRPPGPPLQSAVQGNPWRDVLVAASRLAAAGVGGAATYEAARRHYGNADEPPEPIMSPLAPF